MQNLEHDLGPIAITYSPWILDISLVSYYPTLNFKVCPGFLFPKEMMDGCCHMKVQIALHLALFYSFGLFSPGNQGSNVLHGSTKLGLL